MRKSHQVPANKNRVWPIVVKLGGSLITSLPELIPVVCRSPRAALIVPGGGIFAESVRGLDLRDETAAHWMAVAAMDQYGWLIASKGIPETDVLRVPETPKVLLPYRCMRKEDPLPHSWDVTSDSIAAWVAGTLGIQLLVLKSVDGILLNGKLQEVVSERVDTDVVDPSFVGYVLNNQIPTTIINGSLTDRVEKFLRGESVPGTVLSTTFF